MEKTLGVSLYDNFEFDGLTFAAAIVAQVDNIQYWRDRPLFLGYKEPIFAPAINHNTNPPNYEEIPEVQLYLETIKEIQEGAGTYGSEAERIKAIIETYAHINTDEEIHIDYPDILEEPETIEIKDEDGNVIKTITIDLTERDTKPAVGVGEVPITFLDKLPTDFTDDIGPDGIDDATIATLPDSYIKNKLWISDTIIPELNAELTQAGDDFANTLNTATESFPTPPNTDETLEYINSLQQPIEQWYGIPLIDLTPKGVPLNESYILHINTKENWSLDFTNVVGSGLEKTLIRLDKTIPPNKKFTAGVTLTGVKLTIYLQIDGDSEIYTNSINLTSPPEVRLNTYGADNHGVKSLCGYVWDIKFWQSSEIFPDTHGGNRPYDPGDGVFYPGAGGRGTSIYPTHNWRKPAYGGGSFLSLNDDYRFIFNGYMDRFFCRYNLLNTDFTISWYQYHFGYGTGTRTLLSDNIHSNYIKYDYDNFELQIDFNNFHYKERIVLPEFMWFQFSIRFNKESNELVVGFRDFFWDRFEEIRVDIGPELEFELMSLWGRFSIDEGHYLEVQRGVFGMVMINTDYLTDDKLNILYNEHKKFLGQYDPRLMELPEGV